MGKHSVFYEIPMESGSYVVTIVQSKDKRSAFKYVAYYDVDTREWYKQDMFAGKLKSGDPITELVTQRFDNDLEINP